ncbi:hypothetical protein EMIT0P171_40437 [Pseudomonas sp. IT-P171]
MAISQGQAVAKGEQGQMNPWQGEHIESFKAEELLWRGSLLPLGCEAAPNSLPTLFQADRIGWLYDCFARARISRREQAPSPQGRAMFEGRNYKQGPNKNTARRRCLLSAGGQDAINCRNT